MKCHHYLCQARRAAELAAMGQTDRATKVWADDEPVTCLIDIDFDDDRIVDLHQRLYGAQPDDHYLVE